MQVGPSPLTTMTLSRRRDLLGFGRGRRGIWQVERELVRVVRCLDRAQGEGRRGHRFTPTVEVPGQCRGVHSHVPVTGE